MKGISFKRKFLSLVIFMQTLRIFNPSEYLVPYHTKKKRVCPFMIIEPIPGVLSIYLRVSDEALVSQTF